MRSASILPKEPCLAATEPDTAAHVATVRLPAEGAARTGDGGPVAAPVGPRLTRLDIHGFKSFATRTSLVFEQGITAVIGPNGSGKSNISDAVRWVLGETSQSALRSRRTDDVIFAGGNGRAPMSMAEVTVTFDNSTGWLPSEYTDVTVTRRAFRSGDSNYLINGRRVRLKDIQHLVASLGQSYTVVGQGLMDAALSQRPEERRGLFEHAADLVGLRMKAVEAERNLAEVDANSTRLEDLLGELEPRLRTLERHARQARDWQSVRDTLRGIQLTHYQDLHAAASRRTAEATSIHERATAAVADGDARLADDAAAEEDARRELETATHAVERFTAHLRETQDEAQAVGHQRDLAVERLSALARRREDLADTQSGLDEQAAALAAELVDVDTEVARLESAVAEARAAIATLRRETADVSGQRAAHEREVETTRRALRDAERRAADLQRRADRLDQRRELDAAERSRAEGAIADRAERLSGLRGDLAAHDAAASEGTAALAALDTRLADLTQRERAARASVATARDALATADRALGEATARQRALQHLRETGAGLYAGVRAVIEAGRSGDLSGIRGTVGELITLPPEYDTAIEIALGGHVQDIVVDRWADAEAAIALLRRNRVGRATFQPRETVRGRGAGIPEAIRRRAGVHGLASELITVDAEYAGIIEALLGRTVVVEDLRVARALLGELPSGFSTVTLIGEIARSGGSVTGGAQTREAGTLARERELRDLPEQVAALAKARRQCADDLAVAERVPTELVGELRAAETERAGLAATAREQTAQRTRLTGWIDGLERETRQARQHLAGFEADTTKRERERDTIAGDLARIDRERADQQANHEVAEAALTAVGEQASAAERAVADQQRDLATVEERLRAARQREAGLNARQGAIRDELATRAQRAAALDGEMSALSAQRERLEREVATLTERLDTARDGRQPLDAAALAARQTLTRVTAALDRERRAQLDRERARGETGLGLERARADQTAIELRISEELGFDDPARIATVTAADGLLEPERMPENAEREISRLRERLRRIGYVGDDAIGEYERESQHHAFMREQLDDVQRAAASLRELLSDLHATMRERFDETFGKVATAFSEAFTTLFGGGSARLVMTSGDGTSGSGSGNGNGATGGIDIVAQPPGKRLQNLSLLSGGERSLTAAALLIAILRVNPTPFCLLDEVDAALDEANVVRFRAQLQALARETQVIVITHNRGTIEIADTLYGITMSSDGVSKTLSLRLPPEEPT